jgi:hypothetical protein
MSWRETEEHFGGSRSVERLMGAKVGVIEERELDAALGFGSGERGQGADAEESFRRFPEPLDDGDGAHLAESSEAVGDGALQDGLAKGVGSELRAAVGYEVPWRSVLLRRLAEEVGNLSSGRLSYKSASRQRKPGEDVENDGELEGEEPKEGRDIGEVGHGDVVGISSTEGAVTRRGGRNLGGWSRPFRSNPANGLGGDPEAGAGEGLGDALASPEAGGGCISQDFF